MQTQDAQSAIVLGADGCDTEEGGGLPPNLGEGTSPLLSLTVRKVEFLSLGILSTPDLSVLLSESFR